MSSRSVAAAAGVTSILFRAESCSTVRRDLTHCVPRPSWTLGSLPPPGRGASRGCAQGCGGSALLGPLRTATFRGPGVETPTYGFSQGRKSVQLLLKQVTTHRDLRRAVGGQGGGQRTKRKWGEAGGHGRSRRGGHGEPHVLTRFLRAGPLPRPPGRRAVSPPRRGPSRALGLQAALPSWQLRGPGSPASPRPAGQPPRPWPLCSRAPLPRPGPPGSFPS